MFMKRLGIIAILLIGLIIPFTQEAQAAVTWSAISPSDTSNMNDLNSLYDLTNIEAAIFDNDQDFMNFYLNFHYNYLSNYQKYYYYSFLTIYYYLFYYNYIIIIKFNFN